MKRESKYILPFKTFPALLYIKRVEYKIGLGSHIVPPWYCPQMSFLMNGLAHTLNLTNVHTSHWCVSDFAHNDTWAPPGVLPAQVPSVTGRYASRPPPPWHEGYIKPLSYLWGHTGAWHLNGFMSIDVSRFLFDLKVFYTVVHILLWKKWWYSQLMDLLSEPWLKCKKKWYASCNS